MLDWYRADLHIHTVLSPCAELSMGPIDIVDMAVRKQLDIIAVTDHNSAENVRAVMEAAKNKKMTVIAGMEVYTREEAHMICLFPDLDSVMDFQNFIYENLTPGVYDESILGPQYVCDKDENVIDENKRFLALPVRASIENVANHVNDLNGVIYPAHIDRRSNSILRVLGFIPENIHVHAVEISLPPDQAKERLRFLNNTQYTILTASDAHDIGMIGTRITYFNIAEPSFAEIKMAIEKKDGRGAYLQLPD